MSLSVHTKRSRPWSTTKAHLFSVCTGLELNIRSRTLIHKQTHVGKQQSHVLTHSVGVEDIQYLVNPLYAVIENEAVGEVQGRPYGFNMAEVSGSALEFPLL